MSGKVFNLQLTGIIPAGFDVLLLFLILAGSFLASVLLTGFVRSYALKAGMVDVPNHRSSHDTPTPRSGGLSFVILYPVLLALFSNTGIMPEISSIFVVTIIGGTAIAAVGYWDDRTDVHALYRIMLHTLVVAFVLYHVGAPDIIFPGLFEISNYTAQFLVLLSVIWLLNLFNFMDGIDGLAAVEAVSVLLFAVVLITISNEQSDTFPVYLLLLCALVCGFLVWNWPPAKIFMGDVGSSFLGYIIAMFALLSAHHGYLSLWTWIILLGVFIADSTVTLLTRIVNRETWYEAHRSHAYQRLARLWRSHGRVTLSVLAINIFWLFPLAWAAERYFDYQILIVLIAYLPLVILVFSTFRISVSR